MPTGILDHSDFQGHGVHVSLPSLMPKYPVFVVKILTTPVEMPKLPERVDYHVNNTFTQVKISDQHEYSEHGVDRISFKYKSYQQLAVYP